MRWVRPIFTISAKASALSARASRRARTEGSSAWTICSAAAMCMAVGKVSLEDCDMFTWSLGCTGVFDPSTPPASSMARLEMTSLAFMLVWVPLPVCHTRSGNWSSSLPVGDLARGLHDELGQRRVEHAQVGVGPRRRLLQDAEGPDHRLGA